MASSVLDIYQNYYQNEQYERRGLFRLVKEHYYSTHVLYPGSFVHITPSFFFSTVVYVDIDRQAQRFFADPSIHTFIAAKKEYAEATTIRFHATSYMQPFPESRSSFEVLFSQYAGFVSQYCKIYLQEQGLLIANNSHGDASMASIDSDYTLVGAITQKAGRYRLHTDNLDSYFVPKQNTVITREFLEQHRRGVRYIRSADAYVFQLSANRRTSG